MKAPEHSASNPGGRGSDLTERFQGGNLAVPNKTREKLPASRPSEETTDEELMLECRKDNMEAFNLLFKRYEKRIYNFSLRLTGDRVTAEEITLEAFMKAYKARKRYQPTARFSTWLYSIARNLCRDFARSRSKNGAISESVQSLNLAAESPDPAGEIALEEELKRKVMEAIRSLPGKQREVIIMSYYEGLTYPEIASILKCSSSSVKMAGHRAYLKLRELLSEYSRERGKI